MSMDSYLRWLVNMLVLLRQGSLTQEQAVMSLEGYFQYMNVRPRLLYCRTPLKHRQVGAIAVEQSGLGWLLRVV
jgi:hypothetical protein